jgi:O-antigen ligase
MIRLVFLSLFIIFIGVYAWKDWFRSLCCLILMMAVIEHPDMPKTIMGIGGLNPWNMLMVIIIAAWLSQRGNEELTWDLSPHITILLLFYFVIIISSYFRMTSNMEGIVEYYTLRGFHLPSSSNLRNEYLINSIKWVIPAILLFDGCRNRERLTWALFAILGMYFLLSIQVIKAMPISSAVSGDGLTKRSLKILAIQVGYHRVDLSMMLAGASWAVFSLKEMLPRYKIYIILTSIIVFIGQALTGGRTGYGTWAVIGFGLCLIRWKKYLLFAPIIVMVSFSLIPGVQERLLMGFSKESHEVTSSAIKDESHSLNDNLSNEIDLYTIMAGRNIAWPPVIDKIKESPWIGYGRQAMVNTGVSSFLWLEYTDTFPHPHNAYLELIIDNGFIGAIPVFIFFIIILYKGFSLFIDSSNPIFIVTGGVCLSLVAAHMIGSLGAQTFYPREGVVGMWCAIFLMLRVFLERENNMESQEEVFPDSQIGDT